jgi:3-(methylthio)propanoyl-CoA dehydrogenase
MERQGRIAAAAGDDDFLKVKRAVAAFYVEQVVPEALGLNAAASAPAAGLYALPAGLFAA